MLVKKKSNKLIKIIISLVIVGLFIFIGYFAYGQYSAVNSVTSQIGNNIIDRPVLPRLNVKFNTDFLNKAPYALLRSAQSEPLIVGQKGKANPFQ
jgi:hypothetical protein